MSKSIQTIKNRNVFDLMYRGAHSVGIGNKVRMGAITGEEAIVCTVRRKMSPTQLKAAGIPLIPAKISGYRTDVIQGKGIDALDDGEIKHRRYSHTDRCRPVKPSYSIAHPDVTAGTFACIVKVKGLAAPYGLTNNHVAANSNDAEVGDPTLQPGPADGGGAADRIGELSKFQPITWIDDPTPPDGGCGVLRNVVAFQNWLAELFRRRSRVRGLSLDTANLVDAASFYIDLDASGGIDPVIPGIGQPGGTIDPDYIDMPVVKNGRTTEFTRGTITQINVTVQVGYGGSRVALFTNQVVIESIDDSKFSAPGDSGSLICFVGDEKNFPSTSALPYPLATALLFAGSDTQTIASPISLVFEALDLEGMWTGALPGKTENQKTTPYSTLPVKPPPPNFETLPPPRQNSPQAIIEGNLSFTEWMQQEFAGEMGKEAGEIAADIGEVLDHLLRDGNRPGKDALDRLVKLYGNLRSYHGYEITKAQLQKEKADLQAAGYEWVDCKSETEGNLD